jgi:hypothetical protein
MATEDQATMANKDDIEGYFARLITALLKLKHPRSFLQCGCESNAGFP